VHEINRTNNDRTASAAYTSWRDFDLWNAWFRVWALGVGLRDLKLASVYRRYKKSHDDSILPAAEEPMGLFYSQHQGFSELFNAAEAKMSAVEAGSIDPKTASNYIFDLIRSANFTPPANHLGDPERHFINVGTPWATLSTLAWLVTSAPPEIKSLSAGLLGDLGRKPPASSHGEQGSRSERCSLLCSELLVIVRILRLLILRQGVLLELLQDHLHRLLQLRIVTLPH
jgi:FADH2 O2-dependent halogenase